MMKFDEQKIGTIRSKLDAVKGELGGDDIVNAVVSAISDKQRAAGLIAIDTAKTFITLASSVLFGLVAYVSYTVGPGDTINGRQFFAYGVAAFLLFAVMVVGMHALAKTWKEDGWTAQSLKGNLNAQAMCGVIAILAFGAAFFLGRDSDAASAPDIAIAITSAQAENRAVGRRIKVTGIWSGNLKLSPSAGPDIVVPAPADGQLGSFELEWR